MKRARSASATSGTISCADAERRGDRLAGQVVGRAAEAAGDEHEVDVGRLATDEARDGVDLVGHRRRAIATSTPSRSSRCASQLPFVFATSPDVSSLPIVRIAAVGIGGEYCNVESLDELRERRAHECRLTPDRALQSLDEAEAFLRDRGLLTRTTDSALPSLYEACHEEAYKPGSGGFGEWPRTKWPWFGELAERGYLVVAVHRGKNLLVSDEVAALLDPICRAEIERMRAADPDWDRLLDHLAVAGPVEHRRPPASSSTSSRRS